MGAAGVVGAVLVAGAEFLGVVMSKVYARMLGVCFERTVDVNLEAIRFSQFGVDPKNVEGIG